MSRFDRSKTNFRQQRKRRLRLPGAQDEPVVEGKRQRVESTATVTSCAQHQQPGPCEEPLGANITAVGTSKLIAALKSEPEGQALQSPTPAWDQGDDQYHRQGCVESIDLPRTSPTPSQVSGKFLKPLLHSIVRHHLNYSKNVTLKIHNSETPHTHFTVFPSNFSISNLNVININKTKTKNIITITQYRQHCCRNSTPNRAKTNKRQTYKWGWAGSRSRTCSSKGQRPAQLQLCRRTPRLQGQTRRRWLIAHKKAETSHAECYNAAPPLACRNAAVIQVSPSPIFVNRIQLSCTKTTITKRYSTDCHSRIPNITGKKLNHKITNEKERSLLCACLGGWVGNTQPVEKRLSCPSSIYTIACTERRASKADNQRPRGDATRSREENQAEQPLADLQTPVARRPKSQPKAITPSNKAFPHHPATSGKLLTSFVHFFSRNHKPENLTHISSAPFSITPQKLDETTQAHTTHRKQEPQKIGSKSAALSQSGRRIARACVAREAGVASTEVVSTAPPTLPRSDGGSPQLQRTRSITNIITTTSSKRPVYITEAEMEKARAEHTRLSAYVACFGHDGHEDTVMLETPQESTTQSLKRLLAKKARQKSLASPSQSKRTRETVEATTTVPQQTLPTKSALPEPTHISEPESNQRPRFWLGFETMEQLAVERGEEELFSDETIEDRELRGISRDEAEEMAQVSDAFPRVPQLLYPSQRPDGVLGQHYNITQVPFDIPTDPISHFSLDFHVAIHFQIPNAPLLHNYIKTL
ncbi:hypothetical protein KC19_VG146200 [Ceratodon purpureus]|uniref:Uncharacterized protein n=1 Tax=Ceratodon purpureus TaxID=3225 RepID=A0A8T0HQJ4_CERPU|nr:hypothetical protein KC19_VG146200 [Ceratodon purpureus]